MTAVVMSFADSPRLARSAGRVRPVGRIVLFTLCAPMALALTAPPAAAQVPQGWDVNTCRTLTYRVDVDLFHNGQEFEEFDERIIVISIGNGLVDIVRTSTLEKSSESYGPYAFHSDGSMTVTKPDQAPPPQEAELLLHVLPAGPLDPDATNWSILDPPDENLEMTQLALQQRTDYQVDGEHVENGETIKDFSLDSFLRLLDNLFVWGLLGPPGERTPQIQNIISGLEQFNLFMYGTLEWNVTRGVTQRCELTYVPVPHVGGTQGTIDTSILRQHLTAELLEVQP